MSDGVWGPHDELEVREQLTRRRFLQGALAAAGVAAAATGMGSLAAQQAVAADSWLLRRPDSRPFPRRPEGIDTIPQVEHIVIYMQENQSYDHYLGTLRRGDGFRLGRDGLPLNSNPGRDGAPVRAYHEPDTCNSISGDHSWNGTHRSWNHGKMDGFAQVSGDHVMGYYDETNLPFYRGLAGTFPVLDRWFSSILGPTHPNRRFLQAGTSNGIVATDVLEVLATPTPANGTIWDRLDAHGISWASYAIDVWDILLFPTDDPGGYFARTAPNRKYYADFLADCRNGTLPQVSIICPGTHDQYDEGSRDVQNGEAYSASIINAVMHGPKWEKTVLLFMYDEHGGGYDHVPPPRAVAPDSIAPRITATDEQGGFDRLGIRVPAYVVSPFARKRYVSHAVNDHTSVLKFIETKFNLGALTYRDANAHNLLDCFDFRRAPFRQPPTLPAPGLPLTGSTCQPQPYPTIP